MPNIHRANRLHQPLYIIYYLLDNGLRSDAWTFSSMSLNGNARVERVPLWLMRQAGRYLPEYRALRAKKGGFLALAYDSEAACRRSPLQPMRIGSASTGRSCSPTS